MKMISSTEVKSKRVFCETENDRHFRLILNDGELTIHERKDGVFRKSIYLPLREFNRLAQIVKQEFSEKE